MKPLQASLKLRNRVFESEEARRQYYLQCAREVLPTLLETGDPESDMEKNPQEFVNHYVRIACIFGFSMMCEAENLWQEQRTAQQKQEARDS